jgi:hypothetical protein
MRRRILSLAVIAVGLALAGCTYERSGPPESHLTEFGAQPPSDRAVTVCSAYGCQKTTRVVFSNKDVKQIAAVMRKTKKRDTPYEELRAVAYAVAWMETEVGKRIGTSADRPGMDFRGSGDPTQQDCVDEATTTTSYLLFLQRRGLLKYHTVEAPISKGNLLKATLQGNPVKYWPHWTAVLKDKKSGQRWAVDSWIYENGENPAVVKVEEWYIKDIDNLPKPIT